ncbi:SH3 domain-containing protein [Erythrobacter tepidarius]|uniref:SH3 domain-containing protein n=1 Tax=Erythrobacter tepidarius TaxID=60454 RepID=UPI000A3D416C|nr:SH3 domain-containing protein [Erythrobacter tepidarius]
MTHTKSRTLAIALMVSAALIAAPGRAADKAKERVELVTCTESLGTIAVVDGETQGWAKFGLGSPRELVNALAVESGCFTPHSAATGRPADFLMNIIAGDSEEVDQSIELAKGAAMEGLVRSGAASSLLGNVPGAGAVLGMFGGLGGKKKRYAAGIKLLSPATGLTIATGTGEVKKTTISFGGQSAWSAGAAAAGYAGNKNGEMLVEAFILAFNELIAQKATIASVPKAGGRNDNNDLATVASATAMLEAPEPSAKVLRSLRVGTTLNPTGRREGLFIEAKDNFGTVGWVSIESLN